MKAVTRLIVVFLTTTAVSAAAAFQVSSSQDKNLGTATTTHQPTTPVPPLLPLLLNEDINTATHKSKQHQLQSNYYYSPNNTNNIARVINRVVNRNTKNRQNLSVCSFEAPHSTLHPDNKLDTTTSTDKQQRNYEDVKRSLRKLGITIGIMMMICAQTSGVANAAAAAAATPLIVTHPHLGSTAVTPLLTSTTAKTATKTVTTTAANIVAPPSYALPTPLKLPSTLITKLTNHVSGLSPAIGEIIMSFAYMIIAVGVASTLGHLAENGHVKVMKLMAWQDLFGEETDNKSSKEMTSKKDGMMKKKMGYVESIQGFFSGYIYMIKLILSEISKASRGGHHHLVPATTTPPLLPTSTNPSYMLSRYAYLLNLSFQEIFKAHRTGSSMSSRLATKKRMREDEHLMDWIEYSNLLQEKSKKMGSTTNLWKKRGDGSDNGLVYNKYTMMFERVDNADSDDEATKKATDYFKQKQYEQHHHRIHVPRSQVEKDSYLDSLTKFGQDDVALSHGGEHTHLDLSGGTAREYLDTLSEVRKSTWEVYKGQVEKAKEIKHDEVDYLKEELAHIKSLLRDEQSMYQTSNQALNLVLEAQTEELKHAKAAAMDNIEANQHSTAEELEKFDIKAKEYEES
ncbi:hypothetical protein ACHAWC_003101, partial [Mediolabrus comicus]